MEGLNVVRHLEDVDNLSEYGRDPILLPGQEGRAREIAETIYAQIKDTPREVVFFVTSPQKRAVETAEMIGHSLGDMDKNLRFRYATTNGLASIDQGKFTLPEGYKSGDHFVGLDIAKEAFAKEVHGSDEPGGADNYTYRFGDPVKMPDGSFKYPELNRYFSEYGESYKDLLVRIYSTIIEASEKLPDLSNKLEVVAITHAQTSQIFRDLIQVGRKIRNGELEYTPGSLAKLCWDNYKQQDLAASVPGRIDSVSLDELEDPIMIDIIKKEIEYLKAL